MQHVENGRKTWLLTWNPSRFSGLDAQYGVDELYRDAQQLGYAISKWSCGVNKSIKQGDRIFLIKLGQEPRGIIASGISLSDVFTGTHWNDNKRALGIKAKRVYVLFDDIRTPEDGMVTIRYLKEAYPNFHWSSQSSGVGIPDNVARPLEAEWSK